MNEENCNVHKPKTDSTLKTQGLHLVAKLWVPILDLWTSWISTVYKKYIKGSVYLKLCSVVTQCMTAKYKDLQPIFLLGNFTSAAS